VLTVTSELKAHAVQHLGVAADAADDVIRKSVAGALANGALDIETVKSLTAAPAASKAQAAVAEMVGTEIEKKFAALCDRLEKSFGGRTAPTEPAADAPAGQSPKENKAHQIGRDGDTMPGGSGGDSPARAALIAGAGNSADAQIRLKSVIERFDDTRTAATWDKSPKDFLRKSMGGRQLHTGEDAGMPGRFLDMPTERSKAISGAWFKRAVNRACKSANCQVPHWARMTEQDNQIVEYALHECKFVGPIGFNEARDDIGSDGAWLKGEKLTELYRKATSVLDDGGASGGLELVPIEFDSAVILTPLLSGELFPMVTVRNVSRRRQEGASIGNPTMSWGSTVAEGTSLTEFTTDSFISGFDTNIYPIAGAISLGLDFESDSPVAVGDIIINNYGARFLQEMDNAIAAGAGSGSYQPTGLFTTSGLTTVTSENGTSGPPTVEDYESLMFAVPKQYRAEARVNGDRFVFLGTETSYQRARSIPVGPSDQRRVFGMDHEAYTLLGHPYKINENLTNSQIGAFCLNRYRMYRRAGFEVRIETAGATLAKLNERLIVVRARMGGQFELAAAGAKMTNAQT
jgi:hypothetical protein